MQDNPKGMDSPDTSFHAAHCILSRSLFTREITRDIRSSISERTIFQWNGWTANGAFSHTLINNSGILVKYDQPATLKPRAWRCIITREMHPCTSQKVFSLSVCVPRIFRWCFEQPESLDIEMAIGKVSVCKIVGKRSISVKIKL